MEEEEVGIQAELDLYEGITQHDMVLAKLEKFKQSIAAKPFGSSSSEPGGSIEEEEDVSDWKKVKLKFAPEHGKSRKDDPDAYVVVDPLLEKGKEKFNRMQAKQKLETTIKGARTSEEVYV